MSDTSNHEQFPSPEELANMRKKQEHDKRMDAIRAQLGTPEAPVERLPVDFFDVDGKGPGGTRPGAGLAPDFFDVDGRGPGGTPPLGRGRTPHRPLPPEELAERKRKYAHLFQDDKPSQQPGAGYSL